MTATRLPGAAGSNYALLVFTNSGSAPCSISGYPQVALLDGSRHTLATAAPAPGTATVVVLTAGGQASTLVKDESSTCQTDTRSTSVSVIGPGGGSAVVLPLVIPPCTLTVQPIQAGTNPSPN